MTPSPTNDNMPLEDDVSEQSPPEASERVTGQEVTGDAAERAGPYSGAVQPERGPRSTLSVAAVERVKA